MTNFDFISFLKKALSKPVMYMWGDYGRTITESTVSAKAKQYPTRYNTAYQAELRKQIGTGIGCDCTGLIKWFLWTGGDIDLAPKYNAATDYSASGWYRVAKVRGIIALMPEIPGLIVSMAGHCGVYIGNGAVIECTKGKFGNGVVLTRLADRKWENWCECAFFDYQSAQEAPDDCNRYKTVGVARNCPAWSTLNQTERIGTVFKEDKILYLCDFGDLCAVIYPTATTQKIAFIQKINIIF